MYYGLITIAVVMFGACFSMQDVYRRMRGSGLRTSLESSFWGGVAGLAVLLIVNGFRLSFTPFTLLIALLAALNSIAFVFCSIKALDTINLSLFSLFSMLGGMLLPFLQGLIFFQERLNAAKILCLILITSALCLTVTRSDKKKGTIYYAGVFLLNGMSGVLSKIFTSAPYAKGSSADYSIWIAILTAILAGSALLLHRSGERKRYTAHALAVVNLRGSLNQLANYFLIIALAHVDTSVQYPLVTGGVMIVSTLLCLLDKRKPSKKEMASVALAFLGMLALFAIPI